MSIVIETPSLTLETAEFSCMVVPGPAEMGRGDLGAHGSALSSSFSGGLCTNKDFAILHPFLQFHGLEDFFLFLEDLKK